MSESSTSDPVIEFYKRDVDRSLLRENLKLSHEERFRKFVKIHAFMVKARGKATQKPDTPDD
jgi:hypothetical protein